MDTGGAEEAAASDVEVVEVADAGVVAMAGGGGGGGAVGGRGSVTTGALSRLRSQIQLSGQTDVPITSNHAAPVVTKTSKNAAQ